jgi:hypothetical protein
VISPRRFAIMTAACGTVIASVAGFSLASIKNTHTPAIEEHTTTGEAGSEAESTAAAVAAIAEAGLLDASQTLPARSRAGADRGGEHA